MKDSQYREAMRMIEQSTEEWIIRVMADNPSNRLWRSTAYMDDGGRLIVDFLVLKPEDPVPGEGFVYGPFNGPNRKFH